MWVSHMSQGIGNIKGSGRDTGGGGGQCPTRPPPPPHFLRRGGNAPPLFLRTEQFNLKLELFLAIHQRMEVAFSYKAFIVVPIMCHPLISLYSSWSIPNIAPMHLLCCHFLPLHFSRAVSALEECIDLMGRGHATPICPV